ncbi:CocE/NonD family hydrolase [Roseiterribacter gracilis]|uniref:Putative serine esterase n=1 Tax=Roseiterribacter gracilis TaxID=2812848 RepID=A0A8S8XHU1_9PROT|nr:putative serine esterase [Rhodospirillales bacterium TMPK1]
MASLKPGLVIALLALCGAVGAYADEPQKVSHPGMYRGWSERLYNDRVRTSQYVAVRDGTRLAVDIYRPAINGKPVELRYPVVWVFTPYRRAFRQPDGTIKTGNDPLLRLTEYGYVIAMVDTRGKGASFGARRGFQDRTEALDGYDINEWLALQPWSTGKVGMAGCSYVGGSQKLVATTAPPHLRAIFPGCTDFDKYDFVSRGGMTAQFHTRPEDPATDWGEGVLPVDDDKDGSLLRAAQEEHRANTLMAPIWKEIPNRDGWSKLLGSQYWREVSFSSYVDVVQRSGIAIYNWGGWHDEGSEAQFLTLANLRNPQKLWMGPLSHCQSGDFDLVAEHLRFFDYWLKDIDNGIMREPPIYYATLDAPAGKEFQFADKWPLPDERRTRFYLRDGGVLATGPARAGKTMLQVDYNVSCAQPPIFWPCVQDAKGATFTTPALSRNLRITGHPVVHLWVTSTATDGDFFAYLEDIRPDGSVDIVAHGRLQASARALQTPRFNNLGLPWHRVEGADRINLVPGKPTELVFALLPTSKIFQAGHKMRVTITGADPRQRDRREMSPPPRVEILADGAHTSFVELPVIPDRTVQ